MKFTEMMKFMPLGSIAIILCSSLKLIIYYKIFNIDIVEYLDIQEYLTLFIDDLFAYVLLFGLGIILYIFSQKSNVPKVELDKETDFNYLGIKLMTGLVLTAFFTIYIIGAVYSGKLELITMHVLNISMTIFVLIAMFIRITTKFKTPYWAFMGSLIFFYLIFGSSISGLRVLKNQDKLDYSVVMDDVKVNTNDSLHYIGRSKNYLFLYNTHSQTSTIYKLDDVSQIQITPKKQVTNTR